ncbi:MAG: nicotinate-nucleotide--dimethylbenzimidazole phosphoribosyltransferase [Actinomycetota bacterium]|nr:nicotinate-nucleotide--dimethylbenzimidazole phosphoribosyltransferase [Actinomycetota bacterium]
MRAALDAVIIDIGSGAVDPEVVNRIDPLVTELAVAIIAGHTDAAAVEDALARSGLDERVHVVLADPHVDDRAAAWHRALAAVGHPHPQRALGLTGRLDHVPDDLRIGATEVGADGPLATVGRWVADTAGKRFDAAAAAVTPPDHAAADAARARHAQLTKPAGSLGELEELGARLAGMAGSSPPPVPSPACVGVFIGDHGVAASGVTPWPQEVTAAMAGNFVAGGAAINVLARQAGAAVLAVDVGIATVDGAVEGLLHRRVRRGTADLSAGPAMSVADARLALDVGVEAADLALDGGARCLVTGEMGIGNTTPAAALIGAFTSMAASKVTGRGTGIDDTALVAKTTIVEAAMASVAGAPPIEVLAGIGGLEIAAMAGFVVGAARARVPVVIDGVIACAAALTAEHLCPGARAWCIAGHRSPEPAATLALDHLGLRPLVDLGLRLGEGTGAVLALPLLESAARILSEMATFEDLGLDAGAS